MNANGNRMPEWLEKTWLDRYLERRLTEEETAWFEGYVLDKSSLLDAIEQDNDMRDALARSNPAELAAPPSRIRAPRQMGPLRWAAAMVLAFAAGFLLQRPADPVVPDLLASPSRVVFDTLRGDAAPPTHFGGDPFSPLILVEVGVPADASNVRLVENGRSQPLTVSSDAFVSFLVSRAAAPGKEALRIEYVSAGKAKIVEVPMQSVLERNAE